MSGKPEAKFGVDDEKPALAIVSSYFDTHRGGVEIVAGRTGRELAARGHSVNWIASDATPPPSAAESIQTVAIRSSNIAERRLGFPFPLLDLRDIRKFSDALLTSKIIIIHDTLYVTSIFSFIFSKLTNKPIIVVQHIGIVPYKNPILRFMMAAGDILISRPILRAADQVVFISGLVKDHFSKLQFKSAPLLIFNGVDSAFRPPSSAQERLAARKKLQLGKAPIALFVGRFVEKKGLRYLRKAAAIRTDVQWVFAGWGPIDPKRWGLPNVRTYAGLKGESLAQLYRASDVLVLPSVGEGFPLVVQEALACGLPAVCGSELLRADPAAADLLFPIDLKKPTRTVVRDLIREFDRAFKSRRDSKAQQMRSAFIRDRYTWSLAADQYAAAVERLVASRTNSTKSRADDEFA